MKTSKVIGTVLVAMSMLCGCASDNRLHESDERKAMDDAISAHVATALAATADYKFESVHVATFKGDVQLSGFVNSGAHKDQAEQVAKQVDGVKDVINNITVR